MESGAADGARGYKTAATSLHKPAQPATDNTVVDIYRFRRDIPAHWPEHVKRWTTRCVLSGVVPTPTDAAGNLLPELPPDKAHDLWFPLDRVSVGDQDDDMDAEAISAAPREGRIIIVWPDGAIHIGVPPRTEDDIAALYRHARIVLEHARAGYLSAEEHLELDAVVH